MSSTLTLNNFEDINRKEDTTLIADATHLSGSVTLAVASSAGYSPGDIIIIGQLGTERCEFQTITSTPGVNAIAIPALKFDHDAGDPVLSVVGDQLKVYRSPTNGTIYPPADDLFMPLVPNKTISLDSPTTNYFDSTGGDGFWYKYVFSNSLTGEETSLAAATAASFGVGGHYCSVSDIRDAAHMSSNPYVSDAEIDTKRREAQQEINSRLGGMYDVPFKDPIDPMISGINRILAAGKLMMEDPGAAGSNSALYNEGFDKVSQARDMLMMIANRQYIITDANGDQTISPNSKSSKAFPNALTPALDPWQGGSERNFRMSDVQGYNERRY